KVGVFLPMRSVLLQPVNLRNHRKIVVVDGTVAFTGGLNVGDEYRGKMPGIGEWRDVHLRIEGGAARDLQRVFFQDWAFATCEPLLDAGVQVYEFAPGIVHAKTMVVDGAVSLIGSANMDLRSFRLNFEIHALLHDAAVAARLEESFQVDLASSTLVSLAAWRDRPARTKLYEGAARLVSPLL